MSRTRARGFPCWPSGPMPGGMLRRWDDAVADLEAAQQIHSEPWLLVLLGKARFAAGDYANAIAPLRRVLQSVPDDRGVLRVLAESYLRLAAEHAVPMKRYDYSQALFLRAATRIVDSRRSRRREPGRARRAGRRKAGSGRERLPPPPRDEPAAVLRAGPTSAGPTWPRRVGPRPRPLSGKRPHARPDWSRCTRAWESSISRPAGPSWRPRRSVASRRSTRRARPNRRRQLADGILAAIGVRVSGLRRHGEVRWKAA